MTITMPAPTILPPLADRTERRRSGYCVRLEWPDGSHSLVGYARHPDRTGRRLRDLQRYWSRGPLRPRSYQVVELSRHDWRLHRRRGRCRAPDCPTHRTRT